MRGASCYTVFLRQSYPSGTLCRVRGPGVTSEGVVRGERVGLFKSGRTDIHDEETSGQPMNWLGVLMKNFVKIDVSQSKSFLTNFHELGQVTGSTGLDGTDGRSLRRRNFWASEEVR